MCVLLLRLYLGLRSASVFLSVPLKTQHSFLISFVFLGPWRNVLYFQLVKPLKAWASLDRPVCHPYLMGSSCKTDPTIIQGDNELSPLKLHIHLASSKQDQGIHRHHAAVSDEHPTSFDLLVVHQVRAVKMSDLEHKTSDDVLATWRGFHQREVHVHQWLPNLSPAYAFTPELHTCTNNCLLDVSTWTPNKHLKLLTSKKNSCFSPS